MKNQFIILISFVCVYSTVTLLPAQFENFRTGRHTSRQQEKERDRLYQAAPEFASTHALEPSLVVASKEGPPKPLQLVDYTLSVRIVRFLVEVTATYKFYNPSKDDVEGVFTFPLPEGATVDGYALDIDGVMVDGVAVPKQRATVIFDEIESRGIDPGLIEWSGRQAFKSRVYPILSEDSRKIRIRYTAPIDGPTCELPIRFDGEIKSGSIRIVSEQVTEAPNILPGALPGGMKLDFKKENDRFVAETKFAGFRPMKNLVLEFPKQGSQTEILAGKADGRIVHYVLRRPMDEIRKHLEPQRLEEESRLRRPKRIAVYWDASASRLDTGRDQEIELLRKYLDAKCPAVDLYIFRDSVEPVRSFDAQDHDKLFEILKNIPYDGATDPTAFLAVDGTAELGLLFSDGIQSSFSAISVSKPRFPVYFILDGTRPDHPTAGHPWEKHVEATFSLRRDSFESIMDGIGRLTLKASASVPVALKDSLWLAGLQTDEKIEVRLTLGNREVALLPIAPNLSKVLDREDMPRRFWSQMKLEELLDDPIRNRKAILRHGLDYRLVTPETSLLVLESLDQYLEFEVEPPKSQRGLYDRYHDRRAKYENYLNTARKDRLTRRQRSLQRNWNMFRRWHEHSFDVPEDYQFVPKYRSIEDAFARPSDRPFYYNGFRGSGGGGGGGGGDFGDMDEKADESRKNQIVLRRREAASPYLGKIRQASQESVEKAYVVYLEERNRYRRSPVFYWESAILFQEFGENALAHRILGNLLEIGFDDDAVTLRMIGFLMLQWNCFEEAETRFRQAVELAEDDLASYRGLALSLSLRENRTESEKNGIRTAFSNVLVDFWKQADSRNSGIDVRFLAILLIEFARCHFKSDQASLEEKQSTEKPTGPFELDLRIVATASHQADVALAVTEPCGEVVRNGNSLSIHGGAFLQSDGKPKLSQYMIRRATKGRYRIVLERYDILTSNDDDWEWEEVLDYEQWLYTDEEKEGENEPDGEKEGMEKGNVFSPGVVFVDIFTDYGRENESRRSICITLDDETDVYEIGEVEF